MESGKLSQLQTLVMPKIPLPVDISISSDDQLLWVDTWHDGKTRVFDISVPEKAFQIYEKKIGNQINILQSWDGKRVYFTSSLLDNWDMREGRRRSPIL